jgi:hypothetical protein
MPARKKPAKRTKAKPKRQKRASAKPKTKPSAARGGIEPLRLVDHGSARFSLCLDDFRMPDVDAFRARGLAGTGHTWQALAQSLVAWQRPDLVSELAYDSEPSLFVAEGARPALEALARLLQNALGDPALLGGALDRANPDTLD